MAKSIPKLAGCHASKRMICTPLETAKLPASVEIRLHQSHPTTGTTPDVFSRYYFKKFQDLIKSYSFLQLQDNAIQLSIEASRAVKERNLAEEEMGNLLRDNENLKDKLEWMLSQNTKHDDDSPGIETEILEINFPPV